MHIATTAATIIPNNVTRIVGMPMPRPTRMVSLGPPGVPVVSLAVAVEHENTYHLRLFETFCSLIPKQGLT